MDHCKPPDQFLARLQERYAQAKKKDRGRMLDEFVATTGYHRKHAIALLRGKRHHRDHSKPIKRPRARYYTAEDKRWALWLAELFDFICSKRLRVAMDVELPELRRQGHLQVSAKCFQPLLEISASTMDRFRRAERRPHPRRRGGTKPGTLLKSQIPIRTFADWDDKRPGFVEADLVQHEGGNPRGFFACTLTVTDVCTGWTETLALAFPPGQVCVPSAPKRKGLSLRRCTLRVSAPICPLLCAGLTRTMAKSLSTISCGVTATTNRSPSREGGSDARTTIRLWKARTGRWCAAWGAMGGTTRNAKSIN